MDKILLLVVNYNKKIEESETIQSIKKLVKIDFKIKILIWDNCALEENEEKLKEIFLSQEYYYLKTNKNVELSKIYNYVIKNYVINKVDFFMILDNDSKIENIFFKKLYEATLLNQNINLYIPIVKEKERILSPMKVYLVKGIYFKGNISGEIKSKKLFAINSGMVIREKYLAKFGIKYNEKIKFYGTDNDFMKKYEKNNQKAFVLDYIMRHDFSMNDKNEEFEKKKWRYDDMKNGMLQIYKDSKFKYLIIKLYYFFLDIKFDLKNRKNRS